MDPGLIFHQNELTPLTNLQTEINLRDKRVGSSGTAFGSCNVEMHLDLKMAIVIKLGKD